MRPASTSPAPRCRRERAAARGARRARALSQPPRRGARRGRGEPEDGRGRGGGAGGRVGLRQDHARPDDRGPARAGRGRGGGARRAARPRPPRAARASPHGPADLPGPDRSAQRAADDLRGGGRGRAHPGAQGRRGGARGRGALAGRAAPAGELLHALPLRGVGRPAPARGHRRRDGAQPEPAGGRRAGVEPRRLGARRDPGADAQAGARDRRGHPGGHARPGPGLEHRRPRGRDVPRPDRGGGDDRGDPHRAAPPLHARVALGGSGDRADGAADPQRRGARPHADASGLPLPPALPAGGVGRGGAAGDRGEDAAERTRCSSLPAMLWRRHDRHAALHAGTPTRRCCAREREQLFAHRWQYAGHTGQLAEPGSYFTLRVADIPLVVVRDREGELRCPRERLPPPRRRGGVGRGALQHAPVPLPRLDLQPGRLAARGAALGGRPWLRPLRARPARGAGGHLGPVHLRQRRRGRGPARRHARRAAGDRGPQRARRRRAALPSGASPTRSRRTGRSRWRTTSSATTARWPTRASAT